MTPPSKFQKRSSREEGLASRGKMVGLLGGWGTGTDAGGWASALRVFREAQGWGTSSPKAGQSKDSGDGDRGDPGRGRSTTA